MSAIFYVDKVPDVPALAPQSFGFADRLSSESATSPLVEVISHDLAYILFTSGSTGTPKGVMLSHLNALTFVNWGFETFAITAEDRLSNHAPLNFDLSIFDIFVAVKAGASISLVPEGLSVFPVQRSSFVQDRRITIWYSVPMVLRLLESRGKLEQRDLSALRLVLSKNARTRAPRRYRARAVPPSAPARARRESQATSRAAVRDPHAVHPTDCR